VAKELVNETQTLVLQSHDFMQLVKLVKGHAEVLLAEKYPTLSPQLAAEKLPAEGAIFFATDLMLAKMDALTYINEANRAVGAESSFQIHPMILKYVRIYHWKTHDKDVTIRLSGECRRSCRYNARAIGAVVQGILDNMVKYAPASTSPVIYFDTTSNGVTLRFVGLGPKIDPSERTKIFLPQYRGVAARGLSSDGLGVGLAAAKSVSDALGLNLRLSQSYSEDARAAGFFETEFAVDLETE
jgi:K+-sensing histidine kinase KdpD